VAWSREAVAREKMLAINASTEEGILEDKRHAASQNCGKDAEGDDAHNTTRSAVAETQK